MEEHEDSNYEESFWFEVQEMALNFKEIVAKYDMEDKVMSCIVIGVLEPETDETSRMKALFHYNLENKAELDIIKDFMTDTFEDPDIDDLIKGLGISLN